MSLIMRHGNRFLQKGMTILFVFLLVLSSPNIAYSASKSKIKPLDFSPSAPVKLKRELYAALSNKINAYKDKYGGMGLYLYFAFADLNNDGRDEIFVQFHEEYDFRDEFGNVDTHVFSQTPKGLYEILQLQTYEIAVGDTDKTKLKYLVAYKKPNVFKKVIYTWDGSRKYIEVK